MTWLYLYLHTNFNEMIHSPFYRVFFNVLGSRMHAASRTTRRSRQETGVHSPLKAYTPQLVSIVSP